MEIFLSGLPQCLGESGLRNQLEPVMKDLKIRSFDVLDRHKRQNIAFILFLNATDASKFLKNHGVVSLKSGKIRARLMIFDKWIYCKASERTPDPHAIKSLILQAEQRDRRPEAPANFSVAIPVLTLECGHYTHQNGQLTFISEWNSRELHENEARPAIGSAVFLNKRLVIKLPDQKKTQLRIPYSHIHELVWSNHAHLSITMLLAIPPMILQQTLINIDLVMNMGFSFSPNYQRVIGIDIDHERVSPFCLVYRIAVGMTPVTLGTSMDLVTKRDVVVISRHDVNVMQPSPPREYPKPGEFGAWLIQMKTEFEFHSQPHYRIGTPVVPFPILFQLQALVYNTYLHPKAVKHLSSSIYNIFESAKAAGAPDPISTDAFKTLFHWIPYREAHASDQDTLRRFEINGIMTHLIETEKNIQKTRWLREGLFDVTPSHTRVFKAIVTPTMITLHGPELEAKNRVFRKFPGQEEYFLRVQFADEGGGDLFYSSKISLDPIYARFEDILNRGISVGGRTYTFLGFSHSSLRAHSAWFCAPFVFEGRLHSSYDIVGGLGEFEDLRSPARKAARIGQAFSETPFAVPLPEEGIVCHKIPDVTVRDGTYERVFSDGVATISKQAVDAIWKHLPFSKFAPTCFQIRFAGSKGMLSLDPTLTGKRFTIRPSMEKFHSRDTANLEICDMSSRPIRMHLNRSLIKIMEDMGVSDTWFFRHQDQQMRELRRVTADGHSASKFLKSQLVGESIQFWKLIREAAVRGLDYRQDPFLREVVHAAVLRELRQLKYKARIYIPRGMTLFGVMDESGYLREGEVFVAYDSMSGIHDPPPGSIPVLLTRSPALHPGDVQIARNVAPPHDHQLWKLQNCIVFSQFGMRDLPSQLSGGDLDGDLFHVIWDPEVVNNPDLRTFSPADYPRMPPLELQRDVTAQDIAKFFVDFMKTDILGVIATRHMILADQLSEGTLSKECLKLAELHSNAVDFSKSGRSVALKELQGGRGKPIWRPDFLAPGPLTKIHKHGEIELDEYIVENNLVAGEEDDAPRFKYYESDKILGKLFRRINERDVFYKDVKRTKVAGDVPSFWDLFIADVLERCEWFYNVRKWAWDPAVTERAKQLRFAYEEKVAWLAAEFAESNHQPLSELEVFVGYPINAQGRQNTRQREASKKLKDEFERAAAWVTGQMRSKASRVAVADESGDDESQAPTSVAEGSVTEGSGSLAHLEIRLACLLVACLPDFQSSRNRWGKGNEYQSFKLVSAAAVVREMNFLDKNTGISSKYGIVNKSGGGKFNDVGGSG